jgi:hypothetical protein
MKMIRKSYSKYTYEDLKDLNLNVIEEKIFENNLPFVEPSVLLKSILEINLEVPLATEKAKSELIISPILNELRIKKQHHFTYFSGYNFDVDISLGLRGFCDFIITKAPKTPFIEKPILAIVEAKNAEIETGIVQCAAEMYAAKIFNERQNVHFPAIYGIVTSGFDWLFMKIENQTVQVDTERYSLRNLPELLGVLEYILQKFE